MNYSYKPLLRREDDGRCPSFEAPVHRRESPIARAASCLDLDDLSWAANDLRHAHMPPWKRRLDIVGVVLCALCLAPLAVMIALLIKLGSPGPLLFRQERIGLLGKRFVMFKFRTMVVGADTGVHEAHTADLISSDKPMTKLDAGDARLIRFGRLLRAAGLDELPQLINVWRGEMSIVGPRPCLPGEAKRYQFWQRERFLTPPGLTGLWQVSGKNRTTFNEMVRLDIDYVRRRSLFLDLKIIAKTIPSILGEVRDMRTPSSQSADDAEDGQKEV